jgi:3-dehydroquinate dehydratase II
VNSVLIINGPNLGRLGSREPEIYGSMSLADIESMLRAEAPADLTLRFEQTDDEATLMGFIHEAVDAGMGVIINPAAFTHYSYAIRDACAMVTSAGLPLIEVHLSNPHSREEFRHRSVVSGVATGVILGFGADSYRLAMTQMMTLLGR